VVLGILLFTTLADLQTRHNPIFVKIIGVASVLFFGLTGFYSFKQLFHKSTGLIIDWNGITDNSGPSGVGFIDWNDIREIRTMEFKSSKFLLIFPADPEKYLRNSGTARRKAMEGNIKLFGTPLSISSGNLKCSFDKLEKMILEGLNEHRNSSS
jgi:hypothetical protein